MVSKPHPRMMGAPARICSTTSLFEPSSLSGYISKLRSPFVRSVISLYASVMYFTQRPLEDWVVATLKVMGLSISRIGRGRGAFRSCGSLNSTAGAERKYKNECCEQCYDFFHFSFSPFLIFYTIGFRRLVRSYLCGKSPMAIVRKILYRFCSFCSKCFPFSAFSFHYIV